MTYEKYSNAFLKEKIKQKAGNLKNFANIVGIRPSILYSRLSGKTCLCLGEVSAIGGYLTMRCTEETTACFFLPISKEKYCYFNVFKALTERNISLELVAEVLEISIGTLYSKFMGQTAFTLDEISEIQETFIDDVPLEKLTRTGVEQ